MEVIILGHLTEKDIFYCNSISRIGKKCGKQEEEYLALIALESWNANQGESKGIVIIPVKPINGNCLLPEVDVLIGIVGSYVLD